MLLITCPVCRSPLEQHAQVWSCTNRHSFDVAREGYVNLLLAQQKNSPSPGDSAESLRARRAFLEAGHYAPLRKALHSLADELGALRILDLGCGEGYYTSALGPSESEVEVAGLDIAKPAIQLAAKRYRGIRWIVGSGASLPFADRSLDLVTNLFTQLHVSELRRVIEHGGHLVIVTPAPDHLWSLRAGLFETVQAHEPEKFLGELGDGFTLDRHLNIRNELDLGQQALRDLLAMTPYVWKARPERRARLEASPGLRTAAHFTVLVVRRC
ncbi:putative RNA methyltransferase [Hydrocarboniphaga effusa]|uniref:putative RNA methyltransferase n=1 Tax=Hydrocarboniphaga effusa TaxID=243629 RepID=UPI00398BDA86